jgi:hypothetical protein
MQGLLLCLMLAALPAFGKHQENSLAPIALYTRFQQEPPPAVADALQDEVNSIMAPMGLRFTWRSVTAAYSNVAWVELAVITFRGRCDAAGLSPHSSNPGPLGWTHVSNGVILPFAEVNCQGIRGFIQRDLLAVPAEDREEVYGRALGRVLAHELHHIFAKTAAHNSSGVGKSKFTVQELLSPEFVFEGRESPAVKSSRAHGALEWAAFGR